jgi:hypothetical protein
MRMKKRFASMFLCCAATATALAGCSSIIEGRSQEIVINTNPPGATCALVRNDMPIGTVSPTPSAILIEKTKYDIVSNVTKRATNKPPTSTSQVPQALPSGTSSLVAALGGQSIQPQGQTTNTTAP